MNNINVRYIPIKAMNSKENYLKISVFYDLGGHSYFTGKINKRGYYVSVQPVERSEREYGFAESCAMFAGYKHLLKEVSKQSKKASNEALELSKDIDWLIDRVCKEYNLEICA